MDKSKLYMIQESNFKNFTDFGKNYKKRTNLCLGPVTLTATKRNSKFITEEQLINILHNIPEQFQKYIRTIEDKKQFKVYVETKEEVVDTTDTTDTTETTEITEITETSVGDILEGTEQPTLETMVEDALNDDELKEAFKEDILGEHSESISDEKVEEIIDNVVDSMVTEETAGILLEHLDIDKLKEIAKELEIKPLHVYKETNKDKLIVKIKEKQKTVEVE
jgi:hypothetical protein